MKRMTWAKKQEEMRKMREHGEMIHRLKDEAIAVAAEENIPVADAIEYVTGDVDLRKQIRVLLTWTPAQEAAKAERDRRWNEFATFRAREWRAAYSRLEHEWILGGPNTPLDKQLEILVSYMRGGRKLRQVDFLRWHRDKYGKEIL